MTALNVLYRTAQHLLRAGTPLLGRGDSKFARGLMGRRDAHQVLARWGRDGRDATRRTVWFHAPSVGEGLIAQAVIEEMRARDPRLQVVFTHFSPSAEVLAGRMGADFSGYLPWDLPRPVACVLDAVRPAAIVFTKTEVWPELAAGAVRRGIPIVMVGGTLPARAGRRRGIAQALLHDTWASLSALGAASDADAEGFRSLGVRVAAIRITGDPGIDSAASRADGADPAAAFLAPFRADPRPTLVAGSTWASDEAVLLPALNELRAALPSVRAIVAPHEPDSAHLRGTRAALEALGWRVALLADVERAGSAKGVDAVLVDRVGVLAHLYTVGSAAYVGGGFHSAGLHSVLEPAAAGLPVVFGPRHGNARAAADLIEAGGGVAIGDSQELAETLRRWLSDPSERDWAAARGLDYIDRHRGSAVRSADLVESLRTA